MPEPARTVAHQLLKAFANLYAELSVRVCSRSVFGGEGGGLYRPVAKRVLLFAHVRYTPKRVAKGSNVAIVPQMAHSLPRFPEVKPFWIGSS